MTLGRMIAVGSIILIAAVGCSGSSEKRTDGALAVSVTEDGFAPADFNVTKDRPVTLVITRRTDRTCATEFVLDEYDINAELPLNRPVTVTFTPTQPGELKYGCGMEKMIGGTITVR